MSQVCAKPFCRLQYKAKYEPSILQAASTNLSGVNSQSLYQTWVLVAVLSDRKELAHMADTSSSARGSTSELALGKLNFAHRVDNGLDGCNRLHGHTYELAVKVYSRNEQDGETALGDVHKVSNEIFVSLHHRVLLASGGDNVHKDDSIMLDYVGTDDKRYMFPVADTMLIPVEQVTAETLANWVAIKIAEKLKNCAGYNAVEKIQVTLSESGTTIASSTTMLR